MGRPLNKANDAKHKGRVHLERALSKLGIASRSQTRQWILDGRLTVDGKIIKDPQYLVVPEDAVFKIDGRKAAAAKACLIMLNKPKGYVTTKSDEKGRKTVYDLLPNELRHLHPVGRLDMNTTGLLLMTSDTKLSSYLTDPINKIKRIYVVTVEGRITDEEIERLEAGIEDKSEILKAEKIEARKISGRESHLIVTLIEGKNREIRRMFEFVGREVTALKRIQFGEYKLGELVSSKFLAL